MWGFLTVASGTISSQDHQQIDPKSFQNHEISLESLPKTGVRWPGSMQLIYRNMICIICLNNSIYIYTIFVITLLHDIFHSSPSIHFGNHRSSAAPRFPINRLLRFPGSSTRGCALCKGTPAATSCKQQPAEGNPRHSVPAFWTL